MFRRKESIFDKIGKAMSGESQSKALPSGSQALSPTEKAQFIQTHLKGAPVDLVFVIDTTGSMSDKIEGLLQTCGKFVDEFASLGVDHRTAVMAFGDLRVRGDKIMNTPFTDNVEVTKNSLEKIPRFSGGGNEGESSLEALHKAMDLTFRPNALKLLLLLTDEPADQKTYSAEQVSRMLYNGGYITFTVTPNHDYFRKMAEVTGGKWYKIGRRTDFRSILDMFRNIAETVAQTVADVHLLGNGDVEEYRKQIR
ncbi:MAG TPA: vWA domain-containing protein [Anaerolineales bacterium]|nr:vWA domain-containing protein [Anaerolineales bacterium]